MLIFEGVKMKTHEKFLFKIFDLKKLGNVKVQLDAFQIFPKIEQTHFR